MLKFKKNSKKKPVEEIYKTNDFSGFKQEGVFETTDSGSFINDKCLEDPTRDCRLNTSPVMKAAELQERVKKIQKCQSEKHLLPCYCNFNIDRNDISEDMCSICSYKDTCCTIRK